MDTELEKRRLRGDLSTVWNYLKGSSGQSESLVVCDVAEDLVEKLRKFRFRKETNNAAIIMKIDKDKQLVVLDEEHEGISPDELKDELPERQPRYPSHAAAV
ncbi:glia maturation factor beta [Willisornis vidua]|uniref:Glia maturation factor beta n=1 Tax=Willisornis vidua TaxID=1566151 RepID=A0ABQ9DKF6_9PASS|nr:glia maturation factor beta [Willisornis vidua]